jgi:UDP-N-acetylglucosamine/UDP-N-acetyl-alpha-D-glucosaminouronate 4-epimerase
LAQSIGKILGLEVHPEYKAPRHGDIRDSLADISRAKDIGFKPKYSLEEGLKETIRWFEKNRS